jgi:hypothetical protein
MDIFDRSSKNIQGKIVSLVFDGSSFSYGFNAAAGNFWSAQELNEGGKGCQRIHTIGYSHEASRPYTLVTGGLLSTLQWNPLASQAEQEATGRPVY